MIGVLMIIVGFSILCFGLGMLPNLAVLKVVGALGMGFIVILGIVKLMHEIDDL